MSRIALKQQEHTKQISLPNGWTITNLGEIALINDVDHKMPKGVKKGIPFVSTKDFTENGGINFSKVKQISREDFEKLSKKVKPKFGDVLFSRIGTIGKARLVPDKEFGISYSLAVIRPYSKLIDLKFLLYLLQSTLIFSQAHKQKRSIGVPDLGLNDIRNFIIPMTSLNEQKRIVSKIEELFSISDFNDRLLNQSLTSLQKYKKSIFKNFFNGTLTFHWREKNKGKIEPALELLKKIKKSKSYKKKESDSKFESNIFQKYQLPNEWVWTTIGEISNIVRGASPRPAGSTKYFGGSIPWITVKFLTADEKPYLFSTTEFVTEEGRTKSRYIEKETLLITNSGATLGVPKITKIGGCINDGIVAIEEVNYPLKNYLYCFLSGLTKTLRMINQGAAQPNLNTSIIKSIPIPLPPTSEQQEIVQLFEKFSTEIMVTNGMIKNVISENKKLRSSILRKAFEGKLVPQDPNDEPVEILLQKIKQEKERLEQKQKIIKVKAPKRRRKNVK